MDLKRYDKTRYENIYRHKKNKNYLITISNPKTSISLLNGKKIFDIEIAKKLRDDPKIKIQKEAEIKNANSFDELWEKYIFDCEYNKKFAFNTIRQKKKIYNKYFKDVFKKSITKITKEQLIEFIHNLDTTDKQKNEIMRQLHAIFEWCIENEIIIFNPLNKVKKYKTPKPKMKYWTPKELEQFLNYIEKVNTESAKRTKILVEITFSLGSRIGETRALTFDSFDTTKNRVFINHSINYDIKSNDPLSSTKTYASQREIDITSKLCNIVDKYKKHLINKGLTITGDTLIFSNHKTGKQLSDVKLRKDFYKYCEQAGVPKIRMYDLRHTYVATMMSEGLKLYHLSPRIGHVRYSTTVNSYGHLSDDTKKEVAKITDKYI